MAACSQQAITLERGEAKIALLSYESCLTATWTETEPAEAAPQNQERTIAPITRKESSALRQRRRSPS